MTGIFHDLRFALRMLAKSRGFSTVTVLTLALGIGANSAMFSMVNALLLHPYNFPELDRLVRVWETRGMDEGFDARWISLPDANDLRTETQVFENLSTYRCQDFNSGAEGNLQSVRGCAVSATFFDVLGVRPALGRTFSDTEMQQGADQVAIVSHGFWQRQFGTDTRLSGKSIKLNGQTHSIVGVMAKGFDFPVPMEVWVPLAVSPAERQDREKLSYQALGRLKAGVSLAQARAAFDAVSKRLEQAYPQTNRSRTATLLQLRKELYLFTLPLFTLLQAAAGFVLLLACANLANLFFARMIGRRKEVALRAALGADRRRLVRLMLTETLVLSSVGGLAAIAMSFWSVSLLRTSMSSNWTMWVPGWDGIQVDRTVLAFTLLLSILVGIAFGLASALHLGQANPYGALKEADPGFSPRFRGRLRNSLVVAQVMFALVLLVCAAETAQAFLRLAGVYQGFQPANVLRMEIDLPEKTYRDATSLTAFYQRVLRESVALPGVSAVALVRNSPASNIDSESTFFTIEGRPPLKASETPVADLQTSSADYFYTLRIPLVSGRIYSDGDSSSSALVAVISRSMAFRFWPRGDALGQRIRLGMADSPQPWTTIVGVVEDVRQNWWNPTAHPTIYLPFQQAPKHSLVFLLRATGDPARYSSSVREIVRQNDPGIALTEVNSLENEITDSIAIVRILGALMALFGGIALALASLGVYGVLAESVARRTSEIGIRLALGAETRDVQKLFLGQGLRLSGLGLAIGLPMAFAATRIMATQIFGIVSMNFAFFAVLPALFMLTALGAGYLPARRATKVDPNVALRYE